MTQTKSAAHTPDCRKVLDPSNCTCHVSAYLDQHPYACTNHTLAWHWKHAASCEEFDAALDESVGFQQLTEDDAAAESRRFRIGRDAKVQHMLERLEYQKGRVKRLQWRADVASSLAVSGIIYTAGNIIGWW